MKLRVTLAQIEPTVGDLAGNAALIKKYTKDAVSASADVIVFPEMVLTGYPIEDFAIRASFRSASKSALAQLVTARALGKDRRLPITSRWSEAHIRPNKL